MNIVLDTNIIISALIKNGLTRKIIVNSNKNFLLPEFELEEIYNHKHEILDKSGLSEKEFNVLLLRLLKYVRIIPVNLIAKRKQEAFEIIGSIDKDDVIFIATALEFDACIWSDDKHFKKQDKIIILTTKEILEILK